MNVLRFILQIGLTCSVVVFGQTQPGAYHGPNAVGPFRLQQSTLMKTFIVRLGVISNGKDIYCFTDAQHGTSLYVQSVHDGTDRVAEVLLSLFPNCRGIPVHSAVIDPAEWKTPEGIGLSSLESEVLKKFGKPAYERQIGANGARGVIANPHGVDLSRVTVGDERIGYACSISENEGCPNDMRATEFGFRKHRVVWMRVSVGE